MDRNLGASRACTSFDDEQCYGDYYQWGRDADGHEKSNSSTTSTLSSTITPNHGNFIEVFSDWTTMDSSGLTRSANWNICPTAFRIPTILELTAENIEDGNDAYNKLRLPSAGVRLNYQANKISSTGFRSNIWSSSVNGESTRNFAFYSSSAGKNYHDRSYGFSIRCIKN